MRFRGRAIRRFSVWSGSLSWSDKLGDILKEKIREKDVPSVCDDVQTINIVSMLYCCRVSASPLFSLPERASVPSSSFPVDSTCGSC